MKDFKDMESIFEVSRGCDLLFLDAESGAAAGARDSSIPPFQETSLHLVRLSYSVRTIQI